MLDNSHLSSIYVPLNEYILCLYHRSSVVADTLSTVCSVLIESSTVYYEWLLAVPLLHCLKGHITPFHPVETDPQMNFEVITAGLDLRTFHPQSGLD